MDTFQIDTSLNGFDVAAISGLGAYPDGSGGGLRPLEWELGKVRELQARVVLLLSFVRKYQLQLATLSWHLDDTALHPSKKQGEENDIGVFVPQIQICSYAHNKMSGITAHDIAALWPDAEWHRSMPQYGDDKVKRDYTADVDGVLLRIENAERLPEPKPVDRFAKLGRIQIKKKGGA